MMGDTPKCVALRIFRGRWLNIVRMYPMMATWIALSLIPLGSHLGSPFSALVSALSRHFFLALIAARVLR